MGVDLFQFGAFHSFRTEGAERALIALRGATLTDVSSVEQEPVMSAIDVVLGDMSQQFLFNFQRSIGFWWNETQAVAHTVDVCVYCHCGAVVDYRGDHIGCLAPHARELHE